MSFLEGLGFVEEVVLFRKSKLPWSKQVLGFLLLLGLFGLGFVLLFVTNLLSPFLFIGLFFCIGLAFSVLLLLGLFKLGLVESYQPVDFLFSMLTLAVWIMVVSSCINFKQTAKARDAYGQVIETSPRSATILLSKDQKIYTFIGKDEKWQNDDLVKVGIQKGRLGFDYVSKVERVDKKP